jgi:hypothetical protein
LIIGIIEFSRRFLGGLAELLIEILRQVVNERFLSTGQPPEKRAEPLPAQTTSGGATDQSNRPIPHREDRSPESNR